MLRNVGFSIKFLEPGTTFAVKSSGVSRPQGLDKQRIFRNQCPIHESRLTVMVVVMVDAVDHEIYAIIRFR